MNTSTKVNILVMNTGSSSIKFSFYRTCQPLTLLLSGKMETGGVGESLLKVTNALTYQKTEIYLTLFEQEDMSAVLMDWLEKQDDFTFVNAVGHRIVHGMRHTEPELITSELIDELKVVSAYDPEHLPAALRLIDLFGVRYPKVAQIACFDTSFHSSMPMVAKLLPIPRRFNDNGIKRYGFHGLSYAYLMDELNGVNRQDEANDKIILAHLGNGASICAVKKGKSIDTSMGFTPSSGLPMGSRCGDMDPGVAWYLMKAENLSPDEFSHLINHESGLLGISETSADMRELIKRRNDDSRAAEAIDFFCYQAKKWIGSFAAALGGLNTIVFSGGIGENSPEIRDQICNDLKFLGIELDEAKNLMNEPIISKDAASVCVRVIKTNEELMIARLVCQLANY
jgi:acetate kinase